MKETDEDRNDVCRVGQGDGRAAARVYDRYSFRVYRLAYKMLGDEGVAEDVMQETFLRFWKYAARWKEGTPLLPWLLRVASNLARDHMRKHKRMQVGGLPDLEDRGADGFSTLRDQDIITVMRAAIARLPERQRTALLLTWETDISNAEAGVVMGISEQAMESLTARARRKLKSDLAKSKQNLIGGKHV